VLALVMLPVPLSSCVRALREVLQIAPADLDRRVREVLDAVNVRHGFAGYFREWWHFSYNDSSEPRAYDFAIAPRGR